MKVQIKDLYPNPFRDLDNYPIDREKVENLKRSISSTDFWDNILAREEGGEVQIAYGHHRLIALGEVYPPSHEVDIPVKDLDDSMMIRIMANENMEDWKVSPGVIDETVRITKKFLEDHPEIIRVLSPMGASEKKAGAITISKFLNGNWNERKISYSLDRIRLIEEEVISREAVESLPTERSARDFVNVVKKVGGMSEEKQKRVAEKIKSGKRGEASMRSAVIEEKYSDQKKEKKKGFLIDFQAHLKEAVYHAKRLNERIDSLVIVKDHIDPDVYVEELKGLWIQVKILSLNIQKLDKKEKIKLLK